MNHLITLPVLLPLISGVLLLLTTGHSQNLRRSISLISISLQTLVSLALIYQAAQGSIIVYALGNWAPPFGIVLVLDQLSALMLVATSVLALCALIYAARGNDTHGDSLHCLMHFLLMGVNGAFLTGDLFNLFVFFEVLLIASYGLLLHGGGAARVKSGLHYVVLNLIGSGLFLIAAALLYSQTGTLNMADMAVKIAAATPEQLPLIKAAAGLLLVVFGLKAAMVPLYLWLPRAYASAAAPVAALFAIMTKIGIYAIVRVFYLMFGEGAGELSQFAEPWLWPLALLTLALGAIGTLAARDLRLQIAYLVIVSVGTLLAGVALHNEAALSATAYYLLHSTWIAGGLFLLADIIMQQRGNAGERIITGPKMPQARLLSLAFFFAAASIAGMPPLSGFIGKLMLLVAPIGDEDTFWLWSTLLGASFVVIISMSRTGSTLFWRTDNRKSKAAKADKGALLAMLLLLSSSLWLSIGGGFVTQYTQSMAVQVLDSNRYISAVLSHRPLERQAHD